MTPDCSKILKAPLPVSTKSNSVNEIVTVFFFNFKIENTLITGGKILKACSRTYFIANTTVMKQNEIVELNYFFHFKENVPSAATLCASQNMSVLSVESVEELLCLYKMMPAGIFSVVNSGKIKVDILPRFRT